MTGVERCRRAERASSSQSPEGKEERGTDRGTGGRGSREHLSFRGLRVAPGVWPAGQPPSHRSASDKDRPRRASLPGWGASVPRDRRRRGLVAGPPAAGRRLCVCRVRGRCWIDGTRLAGTRGLRQTPSQLTRPQAEGLVCLRRAAVRAASEWTVTSAAVPQAGRRRMLQGGTRSRELQATARGDGRLASERGRGRGSDGELGRPCAPRAPTGPPGPVGPLRPAPGPGDSCGPHSRRLPRDK